MREKEKEGGKERERGDVEFFERKTKGFIKITVPEVFKYVHVLRLCLGCANYGHSLSRVYARVHT